MTSYEMRRKAARHRATADALVTAAGRIRTIAVCVRGLLSDVVATSRRVWQGPAASNFEARAASADRDLRAQADVLVATANDFLEEAAHLRSAAASLERAADQKDLEAAAAAAATAAPAPTIPGVV
jgi:uncharacterized protein YukE